MKALTLLLAVMLISISISANSNKKNYKHSLKNSEQFKPQCTQQATISSTGSYTCNGVPYSMTISATATVSDEDCGTAETEAIGMALLLSSAELYNALADAQERCLPAT